MDNGASSYRRFREQGDESGLVEIIQEYRDGLILYLGSIVGDLFLAEELAEDTFVYLGTKKPKDKGIGSFKTWLYTMGRNRALGILRRRPPVTECSPEDCPELASEEMDFARSFLLEERKAAVHRAMRSLKPEYRQVLWLVYFEEFTNKEAAFVMKKTVHSVETLLYRARLALKAQLETEGFTYEEL